ncbi:MAG TPA: energy-coupling factor transporter ATPase [Coriobacteriia bacterium]|nr:MAG: ABC transporter related [Actinobacteria bacterium 66_15]HAL29090.1 energy-coupling factor transporter ATPase [Coriobacteriia bacterium]
MDSAHDKVPAVSFRDVRYRYHPDEPDALAGVTLDIMQGEHIAVIGANGSGKSTLARHINALLVPDAGTVTVAGLDTADARHTYPVREHAGLVFQNPDDQMVASVVRDDVAFGPENLGLPVAEIVTRVGDALATVGMSDYADDDVSTLSGGQRQRVAIAGVLAMRPAILLLDEPGAMLDPRGRRGIRRVSRELHEAGMTVIVITQHMDEALRADRVVVMDSGGIVCDGPTADVLPQADLLRSLGLAAPFPAALADALRTRGFDVPVTLDEKMLEEAICRSFSSM